MPSIKRPLSLAERSARSEARVVRAAVQAGWLAVGGGLASFPTAAIVAPRCQSSGASELLQRSNQHAQVPAAWSERFAVAGVTLPDMAEGYVCLIGAVRVR